MLEARPYVMFTAFRRSIEPRRICWTILGCTVALIAAGLAGIARAEELGAPAGRFERQLMWIVVSVPALCLLTATPYRRLRRISYGLFATSVALLVVVYFMPARNGAHRWISLGMMNFQPSEFAKLSFIMALAHYLMYRSNYRRLPGLIVPFLMTLVPATLILREPDLGTALLFFPVLLAMLFAAGARPRHLMAAVLAGISALPLLWLGMNAEQRSRITVLFEQRDGGPAPHADGYQLHHSKQVLALGGPWGSDISGMAADDPAAYHLPAAETDFLFPLVGERWGLPGSLGTLTVYLVLFASGLMVAASTREPYGRLLAVGIVTLLATQTIINTGMTVGLMPITGLTLPLMSYGGSSLLATCAAIGLLLNVALRPGYEVTPEPFRFRKA